MTDRRRERLLPIDRWPTAAEAAASRWFSPVQLGPVTAATRTWVPAMVPWRATDEGFVTDDVVAWYERFARGRPGVIVIEATGIRDVPSGPLLRAGHDRFVEGLSRLEEKRNKAENGRGVEGRGSRRWVGGAEGGHGGKRSETKLKMGEASRAEGAEGGWAGQKEGAVYKADVDALKAQRASANPTSEEALEALVGQPDAVAEGQKVFASTCASCHGPQGAGLVGPNLTDKFWIHGTGSATDVLQAVSEGFPDKGMPAWGPVIGDTKARQVTAFVRSIRGKGLQGKEPQGNPVD